MKKIGVLILVFGLLAVENTANACCQSSTALGLFGRLRARRSVSVSKSVSVTRSAPSSRLLVADFAAPSASSASSSASAGGRSAAPATVLVPAPNVPAPNVPAPAPDPAPPVPEARPLTATVHSFDVRVASPAGASSSASSSASAGGSSSVRSFDARTLYVVPQATEQRVIVQEAPSQVVVQEVPVEAVALRVRPARPARVPLFPRLRRGNVSVSKSFARSVE